MVLVGSGFLGSGFLPGFGFGLLLLAGSLFLACGGGWRRQPEILLQFALGGLAAPHRFRNQFVGQNQPRIGDVFHHQQHVGIFVRAYVIPM